MRFNVRKFAKVGKAFLVKHSADILTGFTACGVVLTALETHRSTLKAEEFLRANGYADANPDTQKVLKWQSRKHYILPVALGGATIGAAVGANYINHRQIAGLAAACTIAETALTEHRSKIEELMGEKALDKIDDEMLADKGHRLMAAPQQTPTLITGRGDILFLETRTGQKFKASVEHVLAALNEFNRRVNEETYCSYGEFLDILWATCSGRYVPKEQYSVGYNVHQNGLLYLKKFHWEGTGEEEPYVVIEPENDPIHNFMDIF